MTNIPEVRKEPEYLLDVRELKTYFHTFKGIVRAVDGVSFSLKKGEVLGVVGESGCGKSVTGFSVLRLIDPPGRIEGGEIIFEGESLLKKSEREMEKIRGNKISMIFQDPMTSLNPVYTIKKQICETLELHGGLRGREAHNRAVELLRLVGIPSPESRVNYYPHQFSGGMRQRVIIAISLATSPSLIIADEPTTALDVTVQAQLIKRLYQLVKSNNSSMILISHDLSLVSGVSDNIIVMYCGRVIEKGSSETVISGPVHPYTVGLLGSIPKMTGEREILRQIGGMVPNPFDMPAGCAFCPRCELAQTICETEYPPLREIEEGHSVSCHFAGRRGF